MKKRKYKQFFTSRNLLILIFLFAFILRVSWIGSYLGQDEVYYVGYTKDLVNGKSFSNVFPPFIEIFLSPIVFIFGDNPIVIHTFIAFLGASTVALVFHIGDRFVNKKVGLVAAIFLMFNTTHWFFSDFAMLDVPSALFSLASLYYYWSGYKRRDERDLFIAMVFGSMAVMTRYLFFSPASILGYLILFDRKNLRNRKLMPYILVPFIIFGLWMFYYITQQGWLWTWWQSYLTGQLNIKIPFYFYLESVYFEYLLPPLTFFVLFTSLFLISRKYKVFKEKKAEVIFLILFMAFFAYFEFYSRVNPLQKSVISFAALSLLFINYFFKSSDFNKFLIINVILVFLFFSPLGVKFPRYLLSAIPALYLLVGQMIFDIRKNKILTISAIILVAYFVWINSFDTVNKLLTDKAINNVKFQAQDYVNKNSESCSKVYSRTWYGFYYVRDRITDLPSAESLKETIKNNCECTPEFILTEGSLSDELLKMTKLEKQFRASSTNYKFDLDGFREELNVISPVDVYKIKDSLVSEFCGFLSS